MPRIYRTPTRDRIRELLAHPDHQEGLSARSMGAVLGLTGTAVTCAIQLWRAADPTALHVESWEHDENKGGRWGAVWKLGRGKDKAEPRTPAKERGAKYRKRNAALLAARRRTAVWGLDPWVVGLLPSRVRDPR